MKSHDLPWVSLSSINLHIISLYYAFFLLVAGLILLIALIGAVTLTMKEKKNKKFLTKNLYQQLSRNFLNAIEISR